MNMFFFLLSFPILGAGIKYIDAAFDEKTFSKKIALALAPFLGILWAYTMMINPFSATILLSIVLGVILKGKIDNIAHLLGTIIIISAVLIFGINFMIEPLIFLVAAAVLDEIGNDHISDKLQKIPQNKINILIKYFFDQRWVLKSAILFLSVIGIIPIYYFIAMILFDYAYIAIQFFSDYKQGKKMGFGQIKIKSLLPQNKFLRN
jgi:hypothetical protein